MALPVERDALVAQFMSVSGSDDANVAEHFLAAYAWSVDAAVLAFTEGQGAATTTTTSEAVDPVSGVRAPLPHFEDQLVSHHPQHHHLVARRSMAALSQGLHVPSFDSNERLAAMFRPPEERALCGLDEAKRMASSERRWLLANIQDYRVFESSRINRDLWSNATVKSLVRAHFTLWQFQSHVSDGKRFCELYDIRVLPHVAILDPDTGRLVWQRGRFSDAQQFIDDLRAFLNDHELDGGTKREKPSPAQMSEEEQLRLAMEASLRESTSNGNLKRRRNDAYGGEEDDEEEDEEEEEEDDLPTVPDDIVDADSPQKKKRRLTTTPEKKKTKTKKKKVEIKDEPPAGADGVTRLQFSLPDGSKRQRRFLKSQTTAELLAVLESIVHAGADAETVKVFTRFPRSQVEASDTVTLADAGLCNVALVVVVERHDEDEDDDDDDDGDEEE